MRRTMLLAPLVALLLLPRAAAAEGRKAGAGKTETSTASKAEGASRSGGGSFTLPLPSPDLPDGVLTVKVVGSRGMEDLEIGQPVTLLRVGADGELQPVQTVKTGQDGRARFEKLAAETRYRVRVASPGGETVESQPFAGPAPGGVRLLLSQGGALSMPGMPGMPGMPEAGALPPGHPPASQPGLPQGHPPTGPGFRALPGLGGAASVKAAPDLAQSQVLVRVVRGSPPRPVAGAMVLASGAARRSGHPRTDKQGELLLTLPGTEQGEDAPTVTVFADGFSYGSDVLRLPAHGGLEVTFTIYERSHDVSALSIGAGSQLVLRAGEDALIVDELLQIDNRSKTLVDADAAGLRLLLPLGARSPEILDEQKDLLTVDAEQSCVRFAAPLPPGRTSVRLIFELPCGDAVADFSQRLPLRAPDLVAAFMGRAPQLQIFGPSVKASETLSDGSARVRLAAVPAGGRLEFTLSGLPHRDRRATLLCLAVAGLMLVWALGAAWAGPRRARLREQRQEALLQQLVQLQRSKHRGETAAQRRKDLLKELSAIWEQRQTPAR